MDTENQYGRGRTGSYNNGRPDDAGDRDQILLKKICLQSNLKFLGLRFPTLFKKVLFQTSHGKKMVLKS